jgi:hypothetical protein
MLPDDLAVHVKGGDGARSGDDPDVLAIRHGRRRGRVLLVIDLVAFIQLVPPQLLAVFA